MKTNRQFLSAPTLMTLGIATIAFALLSNLQARTWTSTDGTQTFEGELKTYDAASGKVTVTLPHGKSMVFMQEKLSANLTRRLNSKPQNKHQ